MTRKKVKLAFITNDSSRKATFKKRKKGLMKKVNELSTLCGITACAIIYSPYDTNPEVWPSNSGVQRVISEFRTLPEMDQHKKMVDQETFLTQRVGKALEQLKKQRKDNREMEMTEVMFQCLVGNMGLFNLNLIDLNDLGYLIEQYLKDINRRIEILGGNNNNNNNNNNYRLEIGESSNAASDDEHKGGISSLAVVAATTAPNAAAIREVGSSSVAATSMFNPNNQQQLRYYEQQQQQQQVLPLDLNMRQADQNQQQQQQQQWFMEMMNNPEQMNYAAEQIGFPFMDHNHRYNMHHHHHQQQQQQEEEEQNSGDSATTAVTAVAASSSSTVPVTSSNLTNTLWFR